MNKFIPVSANWVGNPVPNGGFCEYLMKWKNNEKSQGMQSLKQEVMESKCDRLCWWLHVPWHRDSTMGHVQWSGGEISDGEQSWTTPSIRIQRKLYYESQACLWWSPTYFVLFMVWSCNYLAEEKTLDGSWSFSQPTDNGVTLLFPPEWERPECEQCILHAGTT